MLRFVVIYSYSTVLIPACVVLLGFTGCSSLWLAWSRVFVLNSSACMLLLVTHPCLHIVLKVRDANESSRLANTQLELDMIELDVSQAKML